MKNKMAKGLLTVAVAASMMFAVTACGSKNDEAADVTIETTVAEEKTTVEAATAEETTIESATTEEATTVEATDAETISLEEWIATDEANAFTDAINQSLNGMTMAIEIEGDIFKMIIKFDEQVEVTDEALDTMQQVFDSQASVMEAVRDQLIAETGNENVKVCVIYLNNDDTEIFSQEF